MLLQSLSLWLASFLPLLVQGIKVTESQDLPAGLEYENLALRASGNALAISYASEPHIFEIPVVANSTPKLIYTFQNYTGISSITQSPFAEDVYFVITGNFTFVDPSTGQLVFAPTPDSYAIHRVQFSRSNPIPTVKELAPLDALSQPNGMIAVPGTPYVLIADCRAGFIWRFNTHTLELTKYFDNPLLKPLNSSAPILFGVNGIKLARGNLYFSNTNAGAVYSLPATGTEQPALTGSPVPVATANQVDDFIVDEQNGDLYLAENGANALAVVKSASVNKTSVPILGMGVPGEDAALLSPTSVIWAKGEEGRKLIVLNSGNARDRKSVV